MTWRSILGFRGFHELPRLFAPSSERVGPFEPGDEVVNVVVRLSVVQVRNGEAKPGVLHERHHARVRVENLGRRLLSHLRVRNDAIQMALEDSTNVLAGPVSTSAVPSQSSVGLGGLVRPLGRRLWRFGRLGFGQSGESYPGSNTQLHPGVWRDNMRACQPRVPVRSLPRTRRPYPE